MTRCVRGCRPRNVSFSRDVACVWSKDKTVPRPSHLSAAAGARPPAREPIRCLVDLCLYLCVGHQQPSTNAIKHGTACRQRGWVGRLSQRSTS